ncbi:MAG: GspH/FimT family pseudopilin [Phycisphaerales bacterium]|nr:GspH/FimT family pseudopilin [Phycisphaerales bacterium]
MAHRRSHFAFTLIELVLVLAVLAMLMAMAVPNLRGWGRGSKLRDATDQLIAATRFARSRAVATARVYQLEASADGTAYQVVATGVMGNKPADGEFDHAIELPVNFRVQMQPLNQTTNKLEFYPDGRVTPGSIRLMADWGEVVELRASAPAELFQLVPTGAM